MIEFTAILKKFESKGEKTGWTYIEINKARANSINKGVKKSFRAKGKIDQLEFKSVALLPMGNGTFIFPVKAEIRRKIKKSGGDKVLIKIELDENPNLTSHELLICLKEEPIAESFYFSLPMSHQNYFSNYINSAKTQKTKENRIVESINALLKKKKFDQMLRDKKKNEI